MVRRIQYLVSHNNPFRLLVGFFLYKTGLCRFFVVQRPDYKIKYFKTSLSRALFINPDDRIADEAFFKSILRPGDIVVDVGANIGQLTILASITVGASGKVYSFEPHPRIYRFLCRNVALNKLANIRAYNKALGEKAGRIYFTDHSTDDINSISENESSLTVEVDALVNVLAPEESVSLLKIDTEGFELMVLKGANKVLQKVECIYFEASEKSYRVNGYSFKDVSDFLGNYGFAVYEIKGDMISKINGLRGRNHNLLAIKNLSRFMERTNNIYRQPTSA